MRAGDRRNAATLANSSDLPSTENRDSDRITGKPECAEINLHVVGDARALQERN